MVHILLIVRKSPYGIFLNIKGGWLEEVSKYEKVFVGLKYILNIRKPVKLQIPIITLRKLTNLSETTFRVRVEKQLINKYISNK